MHKRRKEMVRVRKNDYCRSLLTDTLPFETPLIFSNDGFYKKCVGWAKTSNEVSKLLLDSIVGGEGRKQRYTIPYLYKIRKGVSEFRRLGLLHPSAQWEMKAFYEKYENLICHHCSLSGSSIRAPNKVAGAFFQKSSWEYVNKYKKSAVLTLAHDSFSRHSSSFFAYKGYDRLYKFFASSDFVLLEKKYSKLRTLDVSKCFDSIYTHSIAWATKDKGFVKSHVTVASTFGQEFDSLMQRANYNETNGIVIGPEVSRVFAEIIFQRVDEIAVRKLRIAGAFLGESYEFRRYVDDVFIFSKSEEIAQLVYDIYSDCLNKFNLHSNPAKSLAMSRPFLTRKSRVIGAVNVQVNEFVGKFVREDLEEGIFEPGDIYYQQRLIRSFIDSIKAICSSNEAGYDEVSSYIISSFFERIKRLINVELSRVDQKRLSRFKDASLVFLEIIFFFYSTSPSVSSSYKLCASVVLLNRFAEMQLGAYEATVKQRIYELAIDLLLGDLVQTDSKVEGFVLLEILNVLLGISELGDDYLLPPEMVNKVFEGRLSRYYDIISCLYYIRDDARYSDLLASVLKKAEDLLGDFSGVQSSAERACLFLDLLCCPYVGRSKKIKWLRRYYRFLGKPLPIKSVVDDFLAEANASYWFVNWGEVDLLNSLERKELNRAY